MAARCASPKPNAPTMAPALPEAAEMPWQVLRYLVGNTSAGMMNVVELGPRGGRLGSSL